MPSKMIAVSPKFEKMLRESYTNLNIKLKNKTKKNITFIDYTDFIADLFSEDFNFMAKKIIVNPIKKGRKSTNINLDYMPI